MGAKTDTASNFDDTAHGGRTASSKNG